MHVQFTVAGGRWAGGTAERAGGGRPVPLVRQLLLRYELIIKYSPEYLQTRNANRASLWQSPLSPACRYDAALQLVVDRWGGAGLVINHAMADGAEAAELAAALYRLAAAAAKALVDAGGGGSSSGKHGRGHSRQQLVALGRPPPVEQYYDLWFSPVGSWCGH